LIVKPALMAWAMTWRFFDRDGVVPEDGFVGESDYLLAGIGADELFEEPTVDFCAASRQIACLGVTPETARPERRDLGAELRP
jgi:hypothetical protein